MAKKTQTLREQVSDMASRAQELIDKGYVLINDPATVSVSPGTGQDSLDTEARGVLKHFGISEAAAGSDACGCGQHLKPISTGIADLYNQEQNTAKHIGDENGVEIGTPGLGYIKWGLDDRLPLHVFRAAGAQIYTARGLSFLADTLQGLGPQLEYCTAVVLNGQLKQVSMPYEHAGIWIEAQIASLREKKQGTQDGAEQTADGSVSNKKKDITWNEALTVGGLEYRTAAAKPKKSDGTDINTLGTVDSQIQRLEEDYKVWVDTMEELNTFLEETNLMDLWSRCSMDDIATDQYCMLMHMDRIGRRGTWSPKIMRIEHRPVTCCRLEKMDEQMRINYVYYSNTFMYVKTEALTTKNTCAYHAVRQQSLVKDLKQYVADNQKTPMGDRLLDHAVFMQEPCGYTDYYQIPAWWSIFTSLVYQYVSTFIVDKTVARNNANMASYLIFISDNYMQAYYAEMGATERDKKLELRKNLVSSIDSFLKDKQNNGKCMTLSKFIAPDGKTEIRNIEIVPVPKPADTTTKEELEELASLIFWAMGIHSSLIGSFGKNPSSGGTQQRELTLLKQIQLSPRQRRFIRAIEDVFRFNQWDKHLHVHIGREVLSTLDASKTGIVETTNK